MLLNLKMFYFLTNRAKVNPLVIDRFKILSFSKNLNLENNTQSNFKSKYNANGFLF